MLTDATGLHSDDSLRSSSSSHGHARGGGSTTKGCLIRGVRRLRHSASLTNVARAFGALCGAGAQDASPSSLAPAYSDSDALLAHQAPPSKKKKGQSRQPSSGKPRPPPHEAVVRSFLFEEPGHRPCFLPCPLGFAKRVDTEVPTISLASPGSSACTPSSPRDSEYGLANWQLGLQTLLDVTKCSTTSPPPSAGHNDANMDRQLQLQLQRELTSLQAQIDYWKGCVVRTMYDARVLQTKSTPSAVLLVCGILHAWQKHARKDREARAGPQTLQ